MAVWDSILAKYDEVKLHEAISYIMEDGRKVKITFIDQGDQTKIIETFDPEKMNI